MCSPQVDDVRLMRTLRQVRAKRDVRDRFWMAWAISEELVLLNPEPTLTRAGELELSDLEREYPEIPDVY